MKVVCVIPSTISEKVVPLLNKCLSSLYRSANASHYKIKTVIVTDNKEYDVKKIRYKYDKLLYVGERPGFAKVNNFAISKTIGENFDYYILLNDDAWVEKDFFKNADKIIKSGRPDIIAPLTIEREGPRIDSFGVEYFKSGYAKNAPTFDIETQLGAMACLLISRKIMLKMQKRFGFFLNETLFSYMDDVEFSIRARGVGAKIVKGRDVRVHHMVSYTAGKKSIFVMFHTYRNILWVLIMAWPLRSLLLHLPSIVLVQGWAFLYGLKSYGPLLHLKIVWETLLNLSVLIKKRKKILKGYDRDFDFESILSRHAFRTYHGITIW